MLIGSHFKRPNAPVEIGNATYYFKPRDPSQPDSEHVCDVSDPDHIGTLLAIKEGYYFTKQAEEASPAAQSPPAVPRPVPATSAAPIPSTIALVEAAPAPAPVPPPALAPAADATASQAPADAVSLSDDESQAAATAAVAAAATQQPPAALIDSDVDADPAETREQAEALVGLSWQKLISELKGGGIPRRVVALALTIEQEKPADEQRATTLRQLSKYLEAP